MRVDPMQTMGKGSLVAMMMVLIMTTITEVKTVLMILKVTTITTTVRVTIQPMIEKTMKIDTGMMIKKMTMTLAEMMMMMMMMMMMVMMMMTQEYLAQIATMMMAMQNLTINTKTAS